MQQTKTALFIGATGLVGELLLKKLIENKSYTKIILLQRNKPTIHSTLIKYIYTDFSKLDKKINLNTKIDDLISCFGTTKKKAKTKEKFIEIDYRYPLKVAKIAKNHQTKRVFLISSIGANPNAKSLYLKTKGQLEESIKKLNFENTIILRPSLLLGKRKESRFFEKIMIKCAQILKTNQWPKLLQNYTPIESEKVANTLLKLILKTSLKKIIILFNKEININ